MVAKSIGAVGLALFFRVPFANAQMPGAPLPEPIPQDVVQKISSISKLYTIPPGDAAQVIPYLSDPDARVREVAANTSATLRVNTAKDFLAIVKVAMHDPEFTVRQAAMSALRVSVTSDKKFAGVAPVVVTEALARWPVAERGERADLVIAIGSLQGQLWGNLPDALPIYSEALKDEQPAMQLAAIDALALAVDLSDDAPPRMAEGIRKSLVEAFGNAALDDTARIEAALSLRNFNSDMTRPDAVIHANLQSKSGEVRRAAAVMAQWRSWESHDESLAASPAQLADAMHSREYWVRSAAMASLGSHNAVVDLLDEPDSNVAGDAALFLAGMGEQPASWAWRAVLMRLAHNSIRPPTNVKASPRLAEVEAMPGDSSPNRRINAIRAISPKIAATRAGVVELAKCLRDPDPQIAAAARASLKAAFPRNPDEPATRPTRSSTRP